MNTSHKQLALGYCARCWCKITGRMPYVDVRGVKLCKECAEQAKTVEPAAN